MRLRPTAQRPWPCRTGPDGARAHTVAGGLALMAWWSDERLDACLGGDLGKPTARTLLADQRAAGRLELVDALPGTMSGTMQPLEPRARERAAGPPAPPVIGASMDDVHAPWGRVLRGTLDEHQITSEALAGNPLGDPATRPLWVLTPPHVAADETTPTVFLIQGFTGQVSMWRNRAGLRESALERFDAALADPDHPPVRLVFVDCFTSLGGSQFVDSPAVGNYHTYLCDEVVGFVDGRYPTLADPAHRAIAGKSSGGYGAMITPMLRPDVFGALATHAGDALFETCFGGDFRIVARTLRDHYDGSWEVFWDDWRTRPHGVGPDDDTIINAWTMAACWSADPDGTVNLPFETATGRLIDDVWERWLDWDPVRMVARHANALRGLRAIWIDAGTRDQYWLDLGAMAFRHALADVGVEPTHFELFDATHSAIEFRYPLAVRHLAERLQP